MQFNKQDVTVAKVKHTELAELGRTFDLEFGEELNIDLVRSRLRKIRQFYYLLLPLSKVSPWVRGLFNIYVIQVKNQFAGFIQLSLSGKQQLHLDFIAICKSFRGKGLGGYVLRGLLKEWVDQHKYSVILEVRLNNPAYRLYQSLGFAAKVQILHYERQFGQDKYPRLAIEPGIKLKKLQDADYFQLKELHELSMPHALKKIVRQDERSIMPSMFIRHLNCLKNKMMKQKSYAYTLQLKDKIVAKVEIKSYERQHYHILSILLRPEYELLRLKILKQVILRLSEAYAQGKISTNIYDDMISKQHDLERTGFIKTESYFFMYRSPQRSEAEKKQMTVVYMKCLKNAGYGRRKLRGEKCKKK